MPETFDLQSSFDDLARDVARAAGHGDADVPVRRARQRRAVAGAVAVVAAVTVGITTAQVVGDVVPGSAPDIAGSGGETSPGAARRERLLGLLPSDSRQVSVLDVEGLTGEVGLDVREPDDRDLSGYLLSGFVTLQQGPLTQLLLPDLVVYAGTGETDLYVVERPADEITDRMLRAGWEDDDGVLVPGTDVARVAARLAPHVQVTDEGEQAVVAIARDRGDLPAAGSPAPEPGPVAARLVELGGAAGLSFGATDDCNLQAVSLSLLLRGVGAVRATLRDGSGGRHPRRGRNAGRLLLDRGGGGRG